MAGLTPPYAILHPQTNGSTNWKSVQPKILCILSRGVRRRLLCSRNVAFMKDSLNLLWWISLFPKSEGWVQRKVHRFAAQ